MNERIRELAEQAIIPFQDENLMKCYHFSKEKFAELIVKETINEMVSQLWNYGIDESNNPSFYKAIDRTKQHFGVE
jgi:hypothetical protein